MYLPPPVAISNDTQMNIEVYTYFENVPFHEAVVRYRFNPDEVANRKESDKLNLIRADYIDSDDEGARDIGIPTCARNFLAEPATDLDREVYQAMVDEGMLQAKIYEIEVELNGSYSRQPTVSFECVVAGSNDIIRDFVNPLYAWDTPDMPLFIWEAVTKKAWEIVNRFVELGKAAQEADKGEGQ